MANRALLLAASLAALHSAHGLRREAELSREQERPMHQKVAKKEKKKKEKVGIGKSIRNFFADETTSPAPTWMGFPLYYEGKMPPVYMNMSHDQRQDFFYRVERWHEDMEETKSRGKCRAPKDGEKVVYFVQHGECIPKAEDSPLYFAGVVQSQGIRFDPLIAKGISEDPKERAQVVIVSPARKALQTAVIGLADLFPDASWELDANVRGFGWVEGTLVPQLGATALYELATNNSVFASPATGLLRQYRELPKDWDKATKPHKDRMFDFAEHIMKRPETRFIVVTHGGMIKQANVSKTHGGMVHPRALAPDGSWRRLSPPDCWPGSA